MEIITTVAEMKERVALWKSQGLTIGLTPTMGALHEGHMSLMEAARKSCDKVVTSVFVNPIQFGPDEDYDNYPRDLERDSAIAESKGVDVIFHPSVEEMYPQNYNTYVVMETLTDTLCGAKRPGHFRGVCTVVNKLFNIVQPDRAFFGQKDAQQLAIIMRMVSDLNMNVEVVGCPIVREEDGLAKSSRNTYLSAEERKAALCLSKSIFKAQELIEGGQRNSATIIQAVTDTIQEEPLAKIDYVEAVDLGNMQPVETLPEAGLIAIAVYIGSTRLIDNYLYNFE
jgi:pantoate--beta-alanine ligase